MENLAFHLDHGLCELIQENVLYRTDLVVIVGVVLQVGGAEGESTVERMLVMVRAGAVDFLVLGGIHVDLAGACQQDAGISAHRLHEGTHSVWWVIIIVIHDNNYIPRCLLRKIVELGAHRKLIVAVCVAEMVRAVLLEEVSDGLRSVVKDEPLHEVMVIILLLVDLDKARDEAAPVVGRRDDGDEHWCFVWAALAVQILIGLKINRQVEQ